MKQQQDQPALSDEELDGVAGGLANQPFTPHSWRIEDELEPDEEGVVLRPRRTRGR